CFLCSPVSCLRNPCSVSCSVSGNRFSVLSSLDSSLDSFSGSSYSSSLSSASVSAPSPSINHVVSKSSVFQDLGNDEPIVVACQIEGHISTAAMVDCGATSQFINQSFCEEKGLKLIKKRVLETLHLVDGNLALAGLITHEVHLQLMIDQHLENLVFQVTRLGKTPLILGKSWLRRHN